MAKCYQLVGVPASGKSTWIKNQDWTADCVVVSTDEFVEAHAESVGSTYSAVFDEYMPTAVKLMADKVVKAREAGKDIIWDQTSTTEGARRRKFAMLPDYEHIAVVFKTPDAEELKRRLESRPGKNIPAHVMVQMIKGFSIPTEDEGFKEIWFAQ
jgi:predicted kinase